MPLTVILAFAFVFWRSEMLQPGLLLGPDDVLPILLVVIAQPVLLGFVSWLTARRTARLSARSPEGADLAHHLSNRVSIILRLLTLAWFAGLVFLTAWPDWFAFGTVHPTLQILGDWIVLSPFMITLVTIWATSAPTEVAPRGFVTGEPANAAKAAAHRAACRSYLDLQVRHQLLTVGVPMSLILFAAHLARGHQQWLQELTGSMWASDALLSTAALTVFIISPVILRRIWRTRPLEAGELRTRLEALCQRIGLRCRDILVWSSDGTMVNAAVMGVFAPCRFVLLSDGLLQSMSPEQVEAVFGHEAGHVRHRHIPHFLVFALVGWLAVAGIVEMLSIVFINRSTSPANAILALQAAGIVATIVLWATAFGRLSRRFERQADLFGASCATPPGNNCHQPCSVHLDGEPVSTTDRVCMTGAETFAGALERVAILNGIPREEHSWRHSSIGDRVRFLRTLAGDPAKATRFQRGTRRLTRFMLLAAAIGSVLSVLYAVFVLKMV